LPLVANPVLIIVIAFIILILCLLNSFDILPSNINAPKTTPIPTPAPIKPVVANPVLIIVIAFSC